MPRTTKGQIVLFSTMVLMLAAGVAIGTYWEPTLVAEKRPEKLLVIRMNVNGICITDYNDDGYKDLVVFGPEFRYSTNTQGLEHVPQSLRVAYGEPDGHYGEFKLIQIFRKTF